jgi:hypothetical protein
MAAPDAGISENHPQISPMAADFIFGLLAHERIVICGHLRHLWIALL